MINHSSNEVKQGMCRACQYVAETLSAASSGALVPVEVARPLLPMLVNGTKEKNQVVRSSAEMALIAILQLKEGEQGIQVTCFSCCWYCICIFYTLFQIIDKDNINSVQYM